MTYVGHPLAAVIPIRPDMAAVRERLGIAPDARVLAMMPGSRASEVQALAPRFLNAAQILQKIDPDLQILVPMVNTERRRQFESFLAANPVRNCRVLMQAGNDAAPGAEQADAASKDSRRRPAAWDAMEAADAVLVASGTATLEAALFKRPMVISYVLSPLMRRIMAWRSGQEAPRVPWVGLPNVLAQEFIVPELLQDDATAEKLAEASWKALTDDAYRDDLVQRYTDLHIALHRDTAGLAAQVILDHMS